MDSFAQLHNQITSAGYTALSNPLEDVLLAQLPDSYYRVWRYVWRKTVGWNQLAEFLSLEMISDATGIGRSAVSRALHVLHAAGLVAYVPGHKKQLSHITVLPNGLLDAAALVLLQDFIAALVQVETSESLLRRKDKDFTFRNKELCSRVLALAKVMGGPAKGFTEQAWDDALALPALCGRNAGASAK